MDTATDLLRLAYDSIQAGSAGVAFGRNIFQSENPTKIIKAISRVVHENYDIDELLKEYNFD